MGTREFISGQGDITTLSTKNYGVNDVRAGREFVEAYINFAVYSHHLYAHVKQEQSGGKNTYTDAHRGLLNATTVF